MFKKGNMGRNRIGSYSIMVQTFICKVKGEVLEKTNETRNIRWISLSDLKELIERNVHSFYPMHVETLKKYINSKLDK